MKKILVFLISLVVLTALFGGIILSAYLARWLCEL